MIEPRRWKYGHPALCRELNTSRQQPAHTVFPYPAARCI
jgi:hypothetical protein